MTRAATSSFLEGSRTFGQDLEDIRQRAQDAGVPFEDPTTGEPE